MRIDFFMKGFILIVINTNSLLWSLLLMAFW
jgi:hypothetical protein